MVIRMSDANDELGGVFYIAVGHARSVEGKTGIAVSVEQDQAAGPFAAFGEQLDRGLRGTGGRGTRGPQKVAGGFGHDHAHDRFSIAGGRDGAGFRVRIAAGTNQRRIADTAGEFATSAPGGGGGEQAPLFIERDGAYGSLLVAAVMFGGVGIFAALEPGFALRRRDKALGIAERDAVLAGESLCTFRDEHHVRTFFENSAGRKNGIFNTAKPRDRAGAKRGGLHHYGVALDMAIKREMRTVASVKDRIIFEDDHRSLDSIEGAAAGFENAPTRVKGAEAASFASIDGVIGNVPSAAVKDEGWSHRERIAKLADRLGKESD